MPGLLHHKKPVRLIMAVDLLAFGLLCYYNSSKAFDWKTLLAGLVIAVLIYATYQIIIKRALGDEYLFLIVGMLASLGFIMIYRLNSETGFKQFIWMLGGIGVFLLCSFCFKRFTFWPQLGNLYLLAALGLFLLTLVLGRNVQGAKNWIVLGIFRFQPSELIKVLFVLFLASYYRGMEAVKIEKGTEKSFKSIKAGLLSGRIPSVKLPVLGIWTGKKLFLLAAVYSIVGFLFLQREWGTALLLLLIFMVEVYVFEKGSRFFLLNAGLFILCAIAGYLVTYHIKVRVDIWMDPWTDISGKGYQIAQSLFAIASGGFFGTGIGMGSPDLIPAVNTDFIFSAICEEMGVFGGMAIILLYFLLAYRGFKIVIRVRDRFYKSLALGITSLFGLQTFIIIGGVIKLIPLTGITLPFVSYGGSSLISSFILLGLLQAVSTIAEEPEEVERIETE